METHVFKIQHGKWLYVTYIIGILTVFSALFVYYVTTTVQYQKISPPRHKPQSKHNLMKTIKCSKINNLQNVVLAINFNTPFYSNIALLKKFYDGIFAKIVFCGAADHREVVKVDVRGGFAGYVCAAKVIQLLPGFSGYFYINDDVVLNWWNVIELDPSKIWTGVKFDYNEGHIHGEKVLPPWQHWRTHNTAHGCEVSFNQTIKICKSDEGKRLSLSNCEQTYYKNTNGRKICASEWSDVFYIPAQIAEAYARISDIYYSNWVFLEVAVPDALAFFLSPSNTHNLNGMYFSTVYYTHRQKYHSGEAFYETYAFNISFSHPFKFGGNMKGANLNFFKNVLMQYGEDFKEWCSIVNP